MPVQLCTLGNAPTYLYLKIKCKDKRLMISGFWMYSLWCWSLDSSSQMGTSQHFPLWCLSSLCSITFTMSNYLSALIGNNLLSNQHRLSFNNCRSLWICCSGFGKQKSTSLGIFILLCDLSTERFV